MAFSSRARQFCCFLPSVFGVLVLSYVWIICGLIVAITGWLQVHKLKVYPVPSPYSIALYVHAVLFTILGLTGIYGVASASLKRRTHALGFLVILGIHLLLSFGGGSFFLAMVNHVRTEDEIAACLSRVSNHDVMATQRCYTPIAMHRSTAIAIYVLTWIFELYTCIMAFSYLEDLKQCAADPDLEKKPRRSGPVDPLSIGEPRPIPNFKPATMSMMMGNDGVPISAIHDVVTPGAQGIAGGIQQHSWDAVSTPRRTSSSNSPPATPLTPSRADFVSGIKPLLLTHKPASQPNSPHTLPALEISTSPLQPYGLGSAGMSTSYAFSTPQNSFGSSSTPTTPTQAAFTNSINHRF
ncbi:hypothetical protein GYMLUDRAFT_40146 [Collybiopsis luxurians FD-317 M1]|uniref:Uncharacterized protein n=1 Tax=Collybiopsis luxurians FD-317 M1 TaxID=944289 RepID=A0A0D0C6Z9_9AGAR|nr:hypothetical protein GYMLUDRAFT_40146 [Collybiopsis luxurians FD-317 M1]